MICLEEYLLSLYCHQRMVTGDYTNHSETEKKSLGFKFKTIFKFRLPSKEYSSYRRYPWCSPSDVIRYPQGLQDVVDIVHEAIYRRTTVKIFGERHSQTDIICTNGIPIDSRGLRTFRMNDDGVTATIGSGVNLRDATEFLRHNGRGLRTTPAYGNITLGGAIGTGSHGSTIKYNASISSQVVGLLVVDGTGQVRRITDSEDLKAFRLNLGLLGKNCCEQTV